MQVNAALNSAVRSLRSDVDWFRVMLAPGRSLALSLTPNAGLGLVSAITNAAGQALVQASPGTGAAAQLHWSNTGSEPLLLYVRVNFGAGVQGPLSGAYTLLAAQQ